ncbi:ABC transporter substrate-binding protein [Parabacteroides sp. 52]|uniref:ABC transporter substrate-binding protein n=1 Tax=unclassified Parabacteroides TaxID=2649774 RepID=UPI0013D3FF42|nr:MULTISPECIES: ABC transporter substrate-binding protein [unclassified Parabacteroides]MDH6534673.1 iron complex transport system substrate-binding protein [Parabacteroides sp. PM5-20]NDV56139.1 ABC transporter substrate-binding protein [Parabacteroides sp. 52]
MKHLPCILFIVWFASCSFSGKKKHTEETCIASDTIRYARGLDIHRFADYKTIEIHDPWEKGQLLQRYILVERDQPLPGNLPAGTVVRVPIQQVVVYTSVHAGIIDLLGEADKIIGVCEPRYMDTPSIQEGVKNGRIADLGEATSPNVEKMIDIGAEIVIASPFQNNSYGPVEKIGIPIIEGADYMESLPLGRTEWIRFYGLLFDKEVMADSLFKATEARYLALKALTADVKNKPTVIAEKKFGSSWYVPAGDSYIAHLFQDAGADYLFKELPGAGSTPLAFESVFDKGIHADLWLIKYNTTQDMTYKDLRTEYTPYENFDAFQNKRIFGCNTGKVPYYEEFPLHPDYLLKDLLGIFHPELLPGYTLRYYKQMTD